MITCLDLPYSVNHLSRFVSVPLDTHMTTTKIILSFIKGTKDYGIFFPRGGGDELIFYTDAD